MTDILKLEPQRVWKHFHALTRIPRPSGHEEQARKFLAAFGRGLGLETIADEAGNVIIRKPATPGMEHRKGVILQAHLDMVPQKNSDTTHDFRSDPIEAFVDGGWVKARGTTLGADNGLGLAAALAVLESDDIPHGPLEALFTGNEEAGMTGARGIRPGVLRGSILLNLDSEDEGELFVGCAGGLDAVATFEMEERPAPPGHMGFRITVTGLRGGHSGMDIGLGRGNANKVMNRLLHDARDRHGLLLASIEGGSLRNAIPRESFALIALPASEATGFLESLDTLAATIGLELAATEPDLRIAAEPAGLPAAVMGDEACERLLRAVHACPNGVMRMNDTMENLVETSNNLAIVRSANGSVTVECLLRSSVDSAREDLAMMIGSVFGLAGATTRFEGGYPGWRPDPGSPVLKVMREVYESKFGRAPEVRAVHAGLECGILGGTYPGLDMISFGPTIRHPHSPDEKAEIASVARFWELLVAALGAVDEKKDCRD
ncbi:MAG: aminoacyl-histidine dipeptidase [Chlorobiaceae bacterium]|nr:aminoacyl-histidine dipeptidase [Chlorobiaceae bacterium]